MVTPLRAIRIPDELWVALQEQARQEGTDASTIIRELIAERVRRAKVETKRPRRAKTGKGDESDE